MKYQKLLVTTTLTFALATGIYTGRVNLPEIVNNAKTEVAVTRAFAKEETEATVKTTKATTASVPTSWKELESVIKDTTALQALKKSESAKLLNLTQSETYIEVSKNADLPNLDSIFKAWDGYRNEKAPITYEGAEHWSTLLPGEDVITAIATDSFGNQKKATITLKVNPIKDYTCWDGTMAYSSHDCPVQPTTSKSDTVIATNTEPEVQQYEGNAGADNSYDPETGVETVVIEEVAPPAPAAPQVGTSNGGLTYYSQYDGRWNGTWVGSHQFGPHGCGPTAIAMAVSKFGVGATPIDVGWALYGMGAYNYDAGGGCRTDGIVFYAPSVGLNCWRVWSAEEMAAALGNGSSIVMTIPWGSKYHQIAVSSLDANWNTKVYDPIKGVYSSNVYNVWNMRAWDDENYAVSAW